MKSPTEIRNMVEQYALSSSYGSEPYFNEIGALGAEVIPYFLEIYPNSRRWQQRASFLYRSIPFARTSKEAFELAVMALSDRSREVRYRACMLLACSLNRDGVPYLQKLMSHKDVRTRSDASAAIDAIQNGNHHYFIDRSHSNKMFLSFEGS
jgi:hypothetical protein